MNDIEKRLKLEKCKREGYQFVVKEPDPDYRRTIVSWKIYEKCSDPSRRKCHDSRSRKCFDYTILTKNDHKEVQLRCSFRERFIK